MALLYAATVKGYAVAFIDPQEKKIGFLESMDAIRVPGPSWTRASEASTFLLTFRYALNESGLCYRTASQCPDPVSGTNFHHQYIGLNPKRVNANFFSGYGQLTFKEASTALQEKLSLQAATLGSLSPLAAFLKDYVAVLASATIELGALRPAGPYNEDIYLNIALIPYPGYEPSHTLNPQSLARYISAEDMVKYLTWAPASICYTTPRGAYIPVPAFPIFKGNEQYFKDYKGVPFSKFVNGMLYSRPGHDTNEVSSIKDPFDCGQSFFLVKELPADLVSFTAAALLGTWNRWQDPYHVREDVQLAVGNLFRESANMVSTVAPVANAEALTHLSKPFGYLATRKYAAYAGHKINTVSNSEDLRSALEIVESGRRASLRKRDLVSNVQQRIDTNAARVDAIANLERQIRDYKASIEEDNVRRAAEEAELEKLEASLSNVDSAIETVLVGYEKNSIDLSAGFSGMLAYLQKFDAYIQEVKFSDGQRMVFNAETKTYIYYDLNDKPKEGFSLSDLFFAATASFPVAAELWITKPFMNSYVSSTGQVGKANTYLLQPMRFRYDLQEGASALVSTESLSFTKPSANQHKAHPHLGSFNMNKISLEAYQYLSFSWRNLTGLVGKVYQLGTNPCVGSLSSHAGAARDNKDFAHFVRAMLSWCVSNAGPSDAWSNECQYYNKVTYADVFTPLANPLKTLKLDSLYWNADSEECFALMFDPACEDRKKWAAQIPEEKPSGEFLPFHLYKVPTTKNSDGTFTINFGSLQHTDLLGSTATRRIRRLAKAERLENVPAFSQLEPSMIISSKPPATTAGESECVNVSPA